MNPADKMPQMTIGNMNIPLEEIPLTTGEDMNFHEGLSSSRLGQASFPPITVDESSDTSNNELPVEDKGNNGADNDDTHSENEQADEQTSNRNPRKRKHYCRHTQYQIQEMESFFKECPHPDEKQRRELGCKLGLDPLQVKFWFQNKRTQIKALQERKENIQLQTENEKLRRLNKELKRNMSASLCEKCGNSFTISMTSDENQLKLDNAELKKEIENITAMINIAFGKICKSSPCFYTSSSSLNQGSPRFGDNIPSGDIICRSQSSRPLHMVTELDKSLIRELANSALEEVDAMARIGEPVWIPDFECNTLVLNELEYFRIFQRGFAPKPVGFKSEASRECGVVNMSPPNIVEIFMELSKWLAVFSGMISKAMLLEVLSTGAAGYYNGTKQMIAAKFQVLSPAVPTRDCVFVRYCKQLNEGTWAVVDVSVDEILPDGLITRCRRRPSGCIIQTMPNGCSKITWVEHVQVKDHIVHGLSRSIINSGVAYGAKRWISILVRQCERVTSARRISDYPYYEDLNEIALPHHGARQNILKLAESMVLSFCGGIISSSGAFNWIAMSGNGVDEVRIMTRKSMDDPGRPRGLVISASFCFWIPVLPKIVFDYILNEGSRPEWDILSIGGGVRRMAYIGNGHEIGNCVTILQARKSHPNEGSMLILQESSSEPTTSYIIYTPVDVISANKLFRGANPESVQILPSGFTILPSGPPIFQEGTLNDTNADGTLLSIAFQILVDSDPHATVSIASVANVKNLIESTILKIKNKFGVV